MSRSRSYYASSLVGRYSKGTIIFSSSYASGIGAAEIIDMIVKSELSLVTRLYTPVRAYPVWVALNPNLCVL